MIELTEEYQQKLLNFAYSIEIDIDSLGSFSLNGRCEETGESLDVWSEDEEEVAQIERAIELIDDGDAYTCIKLTEEDEKICEEDEKICEDFNKKCIEYLNKQ